MAGKPRIRTPLAQRWRRVRYRYLPLMTFVGSVALVVYLWRQQVGAPNAVGEVLAMRVDATSSADGKLLPLPERQLQLLDDVAKDQIVAHIDGGVLLSELEETKAELRQFESAIPATLEAERLAQMDRNLRSRQQLRDVESERFRIHEQLDRLRLQEALQRAELLVHRITLESQGAKLAHLDQLAQDKMLDLQGSLEAFDARSARDEAQEGIAGIELTLQEVASQREQLSQRLAQVETPEGELPADINALLAPHRAAIAAQEARLKSIERQIVGLVVRAPISGTVTVIYAFPGQSVALGAPIATIASDESKYIVSYVRQEQGMEPRQGMLVDVRPRRRPLQSLASRVDRVGPQIELVPEHQRVLRDANRLEWGLPVWLTVPAAGNLRPGELVDLRFHALPER